MLKLYVLMTRLSKQQSRFPGEIHKSRTDKSFMGMMEVQWSQEGVLRQGWGSLSGEDLVHPDRLPVKGKWKWASTQTYSPESEILDAVFVNETLLQRWKAGWLLQIDFLPCPHHALLCVLTRLDLLVCLFVMKFCFFSFRLVCSLFFLVLFLQV